MQTLTSIHFAVPYEFGVEKQRAIQPRLGACVAATLPIPDSGHKTHRAKSMLDGES